MSFSIKANIPSAVALIWVSSEVITICFLIFFNLFLLNNFIYKKITYATYSTYILQTFTLTLLLWIIFPWIWHFFNTCFDYRTYKV